MLISVSLSYTAGAQSWTNLGLYGGQIYDIAIDPDDPEKMFAGSYMGDGLFVTTDGGDFWQPVEMEHRYEDEDTFKNHAVWAVKIAPSDSRVVWAAHNYWVAKSTDGGVNWVHIRNSAMQRDCAGCGGEGDNFRFCRALAIDPTDPLRVYVGTGGPWGAYSPGAVYRTEDGGLNWTKANRGDDFDYGVTDIAVDPQDNMIVWAVTSSYGQDGVWGGSLYRSGDGGETWHKIMTVSGGLVTVAVKPDDSNTVFTGGGWGIIKHYFEEGEWKYQWPVIPEDVGCRVVQTIVFDPQDPEVVYAAWENPWFGDFLPKVSRSLNGGEEWETYVVDYRFLTLAVHPTDSEVIVGGDIGHGLFRSEDHGQTWTPINNGVNAVMVYDVVIDPKDSKHILAGTISGVFEKTAGEDWTRVLPYHTRSLAFDPLDSLTIYAAIPGYIARTTDGGMQWSYTNLPDVDMFVNEISINPENTDVIYLAVGSYGGEGAIFKSEDGAASFSQILTGENLSGQAYVFNAVKIDPFNPQHVFAGGGSFYAPRVDGDLWESTDGGATWKRNSLSNFGVIVNALLIDPTDPMTIYAGCGYSAETEVPVYKSTDAGNTWKSAFAGMPSSPKHLMGIWGDSSAAVFIVGWSGIILRYDGNRWVEMTSGTTEHLRGIWGHSSASIFAVGAGGTILHFDGSTWASMDSGTTEYLYDIWGSSSTSVFAVGANGAMLHYNGITWVHMDSGTTEDLSAIWGHSSTSVFAVGAGGTILHFDGSTWASMDSGTTESLWDIWGEKSTSIFAVGDNGMILHYDGAIWVTMNSGTSLGLNAVWGNSSSDVFAAGEMASVFRFNGNEWSNIGAFGSRDWLQDIWGSSGNDIMIVGQSGSIRRYDGFEWTLMQEPGAKGNSVTDLAFHRENPDIVYASTLKAGIYISPNQAGTWLSLDAPEFAVFAISAGSLYAASEGGLWQCTGTGVLAGNIFDQHSVDVLDEALVVADMGVGCRTIGGLYMMVLPAGKFDVYASADYYEMGIASDVTVFGGDVTWVDFAMRPVLAQMPIGFNPDQPGIIGSTGSGSYCFVQTIADSPGRPDGMYGLKWRATAMVAVLVLLLLRRRHAIFMLGIAVLFGLGFPLPARSFTLFEQVGLASAPLPVGSGARAQGMGGAFIAVADDATAASWNPAGLIQVERPEVSLVGAYVDRKEDFSSSASPEIDNTGNVSYSDINFASATLPFHWHKNMVVSISYQRLFDFKRQFQYQRNLSAPGVDLNQQIRYDQDGYVSAVGFAGAIEITPTLSLGATINVWTDQLGYSNGWTENYNETTQGRQSGVPVTISTTIQDRYEQFRGINFNLGLLWDTGQWGTFGAVIKTPFTATIQHRFQFSQTTTYGDPVNADSTAGPIVVEEQVDLDMPISYGLGWSRRFRDIFTIGIDIYRTEWGGYSLTNGQGEKFSPIDGRPESESKVDATTHVRVGAEYLFLMPQRHMAIPVRAGLFYDPEPSEGSPNDLFGLALGVGFALQRCSVDLAYQLRWANGVDSGNLIAGSEADITQHTFMASVIYYF